MIEPSTANPDLNLVVPSRSHIAWHLLRPLHLLLYLILVAFASTRFWLGTRDTDIYLDLFRNYSSYTGQIEPGFALLIEAVKFMRGGELGFLFACAALGVGLKYFSILKYSNFIKISLCLYIVNFFFLHELIQIRAGIATGFILIGIQFVEQRRFLPFCLLALVATCFHFSAIIFICIYPLGSKKFRSSYLLLFGALLVGFTFVVDMGGIFLKFMSNLIPRIDLYSDLLIIGQHSDIRLFNVETIIRLSMILFLFVIRKRLCPRIPYFHIFLKMLILALLSFFLFRQLPVVAFRISELFDVAMIFAYPVVILAFRDRWHGYIILFSLMVIYILMLRPLQSYF